MIKLNKYNPLLLKLLPFIFILFSMKTMVAIDPPVLRCASVNPDGSISFEWEPSTDPAVEGYIIYQSNDVQIANVVGIGTSNFLYNGLGDGIDPRTQQYCFYMYSYSNGETEFSEQSEVTCTIFIELSNSSIPIGYVQIDISEAYTFWGNPPNENYLLYLSKDGGVEEIANYTPLNSNVFLYPIVDCDANYEFHVFASGSFCNSNRVGDDFHDTFNPPEPFITSIYIDSTDLNVDIEWSMPFLDDEPSIVNVGGYIIYQCDPFNLNNTIAIDTLFGLESTSYSFETSSTSFEQFPFAVAAFDVCTETNGDYSNLTPGHCNTPILLAPPTFDCDFIVLKWLPYVGWDTGWDDAFGVGSYEILMRENNQPDVSLGNSDLSSFDGTYYVDTLYNLDFGSSFKFFIKAHSFLFDYTAISNGQTVNLSPLAGPEKTYLGSASVIAPDEIEITIKTDTTVREHDYVIQKREETDDVYQDLVTITNASENFLNYIDTENLHTNKFSYEYRVVVVNYCGDTVAITNSARTMLAKSTSNDVNIFNSINWSAYNEFELPVDNYTIYRSNISGVLGEEIDFVPNNTTSYIDYIGEEALQTNGFMCYTILATETTGNIHNYQGESYSNQVCSQFDPFIYIPNAFLVGGVNNVFEPVISLADYNNYSMEIYSRSGNLVFRSTDYDIGWNGKNDGKELTDGAYIYIISIKDGQGKLHENKGMVFKLSQ